MILGVPVDQIEDIFKLTNGRVNVFWEFRVVVMKVLFDFLVCLIEYVGNWGGCFIINIFKMMRLKFSVVTPMSNDNLLVLGKPDL